MSQKLSEAEDLNLKSKGDLGNDWVRDLSSSKFNYWAGYVANFSLVIWLLSRFFQSGKSQFGVGAWCLSFFLGIFLWTFLEYMLHRFGYHDIKSVFSHGHELHHNEPKALLGVPWYLTAVLVLSIYYVLAKAFSPAWTGSLMGWIWLGYIGYCAAHHSVHHFDSGPAWFRKMRRHHLLHHARENRNWGITTSLWDRLLRSHDS